MKRTTAGIMSAFALAAMITGCSDRHTSPMQPPAGPQATVITATGDIAAKVGTPVYILPV